MNYFNFPIAHFFQASINRPCPKHDTLRNLFYMTDKHMYHLHRKSTLFRKSRKYLTKEDAGITNADGKAFNILIIRKMQNKSILQYHYVLTKMTKIKQTDNTKYWPRCGAMRTHIHCR